MRPGPAVGELAPGEALDHALGRPGLGPGPSPSSRPARIPRPAGCRATRTTVPQVLERCPGRRSPRRGGAEQAVGPLFRRRAGASGRPRRCRRPGREPARGPGSAPARPPRAPVSRSANASSRTSTARGGSGPGGAARAASAASRRRGQAQSPATSRPQRDSRYVSRARPTSSGSSCRAALSSSRRRIAGTSLVQGDLSAQPLHLGGPQLVQRPGLDGDQQSQRRVQRAGVTGRPRRREQPLRPPSRIRGQQRRALPERGRRGQPPARLRPARRPLELRRRRPRLAPVRPEPGARPADRDQPADR